MARNGAGPAEVTRRLAGKVNRSAETIRYILRQHDADNPDLAVFPHHHGPAGSRTRREVFESYRGGNSIDAIAKEFGRSKASVRRIVAESRAQWVMELPLDYVPSDEFSAPQAEKDILGSLPPSDQPARKVRRPDGLPPYLASLYEVPLLTREQESHLFRKMNYLKYRASRLLVRLDLSHPSMRLMDKIENLHDEAVATKNEILRANLRLVVSIAKRYVTPADEFFDLVSDGNMTLIRAVEKFDYTRGNKFSTYASWALVKNFARSIPNELRHRDRFRTGHDEMLLTTEDERIDGQGEDSLQLQRESEIRRILGRLTDREQSVIAYRFGLTRDRDPSTLKEVGAMLGVSKERARQIEARAISKLREAAEEEQIELTAV
jgi:RNA polymerase primary sigma factor/RNA polymerase sigma factor